MVFYLNSGGGGGGSFLFTLIHNQILYMQNEFVSIYNELKRKICKHVQFSYFVNLLFVIRRI